MSSRRSRGNGCCSSRRKWWFRFLLIDCPWLIVKVALFGLHSLFSALYSFWTGQTEEPTTQMPESSLQQQQPSAHHLKSNSTKSIVSEPGPLKKKKPDRKRKRKKRKKKPKNKRQASVESLEEKEPPPPSIDTLDSRNVFHQEKIEEELLAGSLGFSLLALDAPRLTPPPQEENVWRNSSKRKKRKPDGRSDRVVSWPQKSQQITQNRMKSTQSIYYQLKEKDMKARKQRTRPPIPHNRSEVITPPLPQRFHRGKARHSSSPAPRRVGGSPSPRVYSRKYDRQKDRPHYEYRRKILPEESIDVYSTRDERSQSPTTDESPNDERDVVEASPTPLSLDSETTQEEEKPKISSSDENAEEEVEAEIHELFGEPLSFVSNDDKHDEISDDMDKVRENVEPPRPSDVVDKRTQERFSPDSVLEEYLFGLPLPDDKLESFSMERRTISATTLPSPSTSPSTSSGEYTHPQMAPYYYMSQDMNRYYVAQQYVDFQSYPSHYQAYYYTNYLNQQSSYPKNSSFEYHQNSQSSSSHHARHHFSQEDSGRSATAPPIPRKPFVFKELMNDSEKQSLSKYCKNEFPDYLLKKWFKIIHENADWNKYRLKDDRFEDKLSRHVAWFTAPGCTCEYSYGNIVVDHQTIPDWLQQIQTMVFETSGIPVDSAPNSCNINLYGNEDGCIGWHCDNEALFDSLNNPCKIISFSLGESRTFEIRKRYRPGSVISQVLGSGDILTMEGLFQRHYEHRVPPDSTKKNERINLTWRWIKQHRPTCPQFDGATK